MGLNHQATVESDRIARESFALYRMTDAKIENHIADGLTKRRQADGQAVSIEVLQLPRVYLDRTPIV